MSAPVVDWTVERVETLRLGVAAGLSFSQIAQRVGSGCTRCAAIGKAARMGFSQPSRASAPSLARRPKPANHSPSKPRRFSGSPHPAAGENTSRVNGLNGSGKNHCTNENIDPTWAGAVEPARIPFDRANLSAPGEPRPPRVVIPFREEGPGLRTIMTIRPFGECRFPIGDPLDPSFTFCGHHVERGSYCEPHRIRTTASSSGGRL